MKKRNAFIIAALTVITLALSACGNQTDASADKVTNNTPVAMESVEVEPTEEIQQPETEVQAEVEVQPTEEVVEESSEVVMEETTTEDPKVEMVDFETWAKQEDHDDVCLVVWNEELGIQEIVPTVEESKKTYKIQEGDKFAIPHRSNISYILINKVQCPPFDESGYSEISLKQGELTRMNIAYTNEAGEEDILTYLFK